MQIGSFSLLAATFVAFYSFIVGIIGARLERTSLIASARNGLILTAFLAVVSLASLGGSFLSHDYNVVYVWQNSNNEMHPLYRIAAIWGGMDGSMLLWAALLCVYSALAVIYTPTVSKKLFSWVIPVLSGANLFFLLLVSFLTNPFRVIPTGNLPLDGNGLNPLLQNPSMVIHPPLLYLGFTGFAIPFAFSFAALISGVFSDSWIALTKRWTLIAWGFLTMGIILGGNWAYIELGWGGFWAWDPVENSSFLPWLTGTALIHSVMVEQKRGMLKMWNISLAVLTYALTVFGTFLTRSGVVQSVHSFAESDIGWTFLLYLGILGVTFAILFVYRFKELRAENQIVSWFSREAAFLFNNLLFLSICFATFWGVMYPVFSEALGKEKSVVGAPFFNAVNVPLFLMLLFLMGAGPLLAWRKTSYSALRRVFLKPLIYGTLITILFLWLDFSRIYSALAFGLVVFALAAIGSEFHKGAKARKSSDEKKGANNLFSFLPLLIKKPEKYAGLLVHVGIGVMAVAITASSAYKIEKDFSIKPGGEYLVGDFRLELESIQEKDFRNYESVRAVVNVFEKSGKKKISVLHPEKRFYKKRNEPTTEVDIRMTLKEDLYIALAGFETEQDVGSQNPSVIFKVFINPLQVWLWFGTLIVLIGTLLVIWGASKPSYANKESITA
jgi:cytochrome c-type biogenesis protein CcmF